MRTFEEILTIAKGRDVDLILLGGDLYHDNKPSRRTTYESMALLREYCMGDKPCQLNFLSDQSSHFKDRFATANYLDPNINVSIPVFSIHGNHDDPTGDGRYSAIDLLSVAGFLNYFGKHDDVDEITLSPILLQKGTTKLSIYGMGNVRDERLNRTFRRRKVQMLRPAETDKEWFNIMVLHQNRAAHGAKNYIPETFLDSFLDFVMWGHEHECLIDPTESSKGFLISQPGSSIATSLSEGEAKEKHIGILRVRNGQYAFEKIRLKTVRPFIKDEIVLQDELGDSKSEAKLIAFLKKRVKSLVVKANREWSSMNETDADTPLPLIRLRVEYTGFSAINPQQFGHFFVGIVANPKDILLFYRKKTSATTSSKKASEAKLNPVVPESLPKVDNFNVQSLVNEYLSVQSLSILPENQLFAAWEILEKKSSEKQDAKSILSTFVEQSLERTRALMQSSGQIAENPDLKSKAMAAKEKLETDFANSGAALEIKVKKTPKGKEPATTKKSTTKPKSSSTTARGRQTKAKAKAKKVESEEEEEPEEDAQEEDDEEVSFEKAKTVRGPPKLTQRKLPFGPSY